LERIPTSGSNKGQGKEPDFRNRINLLPRKIQPQR